MLLCIYPTPLLQAEYSTRFICEVQKVSIQGFPFQLVDMPKLKGSVYLAIYP